MNKILIAKNCSTGKYDISQDQALTSDVLVIFCTGICISYQKFFSLVYLSLIVEIVRTISVSRRVALRSKANFCLLFVRSLRLSPSSDRCRPRIHCLVAEKRKRKRNVGGSERRTSPPMSNRRLEELRQWRRLGQTHPTRRWRA